MNKEEIFHYLAEQDVSILSELLQIAYDQMDTNQRRAVFGNIAKKIPSTEVDGTELLDEIKDFYSDSLAGQYYAPFEINSKNYSHIPEETEEWFETLGDFLTNSAKLTKQGNHQLAIDCFTVLYELIEHMENGEEIIFADECGSWMIPADEKIFLKAFLTSLAALKNAKGFTEVALPLIRRDSFMSFANKVYAFATKVANKDQKAFLVEEVKRQNVRTKPNR